MELCAAPLENTRGMTYYSRQQPKLIRTSGSGVRLDQYCYFSSANQDRSSSQSIVLAFPWLRTR